MSNKVNKIDLFVCFFMLMTIIIVQTAILFSHPIGWYQGFYRILSVVNLVVAVCFAYYAVMGFRNKGNVNACMALQCAGVLISILSCQDFLDRLEIMGNSTFALNYFMMAPYVAGIILAGGVFIVTKTIRARS